MGGGSRPGSCRCSVADHRRQLRLPRLSRRWVKGSEDQLTGEVARVSAAMPEWKWIDLWASADPATNRPLFDALPERVTSHKVRNLGSTILDHITYWSNTTEFVSEIVNLANSVSNPKPLTPRTREQKRTTVEVRHRRVDMLVVARLVFFASLAAGGVLMNGEIIGRWLLDRAGSLFGQDWSWSEAQMLGYGAFLAAGLLVWVGMLTLVAGEYWLAAAYAVTVGLGVAVVLKVLTGDETTLASAWAFARAARAVASAPDGFAPPSTR